MKIDQILYFDAISIPPNRLTEIIVHNVANTDPDGPAFVLVGWHSDNSLYDADMFVSPVGLELIKQKGCSDLSAFVEPLAATIEGRWSVKYVIGEQRPAHFQYSYNHLQFHSDGEFHRNQLLQAIVKTLTL